MKRKRIVNFIVVIVFFVAIAGSFILGRQYALLQVKESIEVEDIQKHCENWLVIGISYMSPLLPQEDADVFEKEIYNLLDKTPTLKEEQELIDKMLDKLLELEDDVPE